MQEVREQRPRRAASHDAYLCAHARSSSSGGCGIVGLRCTETLTIIVVVQDALSDGESGVGGRHPAVDRPMQKHLLDLFLGQTVAQGGPDVQRQLFELPPRHERGQCDAAARLAVQPGRVQISPRVARCRGPGSLR